MAHCIIQHELSLDWEKAMLRLNVRFLTAASTSCAPMFSCPLFTAACRGFFKKYQLVPTSLRDPGKFRVVCCGSQAAGGGAGGSACFPPATPLLSQKQAHRLGQEMSKLPSRKREEVSIVVTLKGVKPPAPPELPRSSCFYFQHSDLALFREGQLAIR